MLLSAGLYVGYRLQSLLIKQKHVQALQSVDTRADPSLDLVRQRAEVTKQWVPLYYRYRKQLYKLEVSIFLVWGLSKGLGTEILLFYYIIF